MSTSTTTSALMTLTWNERTTASRRPSIRPVITTASAISIVVSTPARIDGRYCAIRFGLKKVSRNAFIMVLVPRTQVHSPPPCGEGLGVGVDVVAPTERLARPPSLALPRKGGGNRPCVRLAQTSPRQLRDEGLRARLLRGGKD